MNWNDYFRYDEATGELVFLPRPATMFKTQHACNSWNTTFANKSAGCRRSQRGVPHCITVVIRGKQVNTHRIVWEMHHGPIPDGMMIDHINRDAWDNRIENLRLATAQQNSANQGVRRTNKSRFKGVSVVQGGIWRATIGISGKKRHLGYFRDPLKAHEAYCEAARSTHGEYARGI